MWTCPKCQQQFVNTNQWHSCGENSLDQFLEGKTEVALELYDALLTEFRGIGKFVLHPAKSRIALNNRMRFASINRLGKDFLNGHLVLRDRYDETSCFHKIDSVTKNAHVHHFKLVTSDDITEELKSFMKVAYWQK